MLDVAGREVSVLADGMYAPGRYTVSWDGRMNGGRVPGGMYFVRYVTPEKRFVRRIVVAR
jgi:hypothetical protein